MAEFPALPLWTDAYLGDTRHLSAAQHGTYLLLLMEAWRRPTCSLPADDGVLAKLAAMTPEQWAVEKTTVLAFWTFDARGKVWRQKKLSKERKFVSKSSKSQRDKATKRWQKRKKHDAAAYAGAMPEGMPDACRIDAPTPTPTGKILNNKGGMGGKNGKSKNGDIVTVVDPLDRVARFQASIAKAIGPGGWEIVSAAADPESPEHARCLALCKAKAVDLGKGWPNRWFG